METTTRQFICIVEDDYSIQGAYADLLEDAGLERYLDLYFVDYYRSFCRFAMDCTDHIAVVVTDHNLRGFHNGRDVVSYVQHAGVLPYSLEGPKIIRCSGFREPGYPPDIPYFRKSELEACCAAATELLRAAR